MWLLHELCFTRPLHVPGISISVSSEHLASCFCAHQPGAACRVTLSAEAARKALRFDEVRTRAGEALIVVSAVAYDSEAQQARPMHL